MPENADRLFKIQPIIEYFLNKFDIVYKPKQNLSLNEAIGSNNSPTEAVWVSESTTHYGMLVRKLCESKRIYNRSGQRLQNLVKDLLDKYENIWHHVYMHNYYKSVELAEHLLSRKIWICDTIRENRALPHDIKKIS